jgi:hypothetical protein
MLLVYSTRPLVRYLADLQIVDANTRLSTTMFILQYSKFECQKTSTSRDTGIRSQPAPAKLSPETDCTDYTKQTTGSYYVTHREREIITSHCTNYMRYVMTHDMIPNILPPFVMVITKKYYNADMG